MTDADMQNIFAVNAFGPYYLSRALMRSWLDLPVSLSGGAGGNVDIRKVPTNALKGKQLLFVSSISALVAMNPQHQSAYNASKGAVTMFSKVSPPLRESQQALGLLMCFENCKETDPACLPSSFTAFLSSESRWRMGSPRRLGQHHLTRLRRDRHDHQHGRAWTRVLEGMEEEDSGAQVRIQRFLKQLFSPGSRGLFAVVGTWGSS